MLWNENENRLRDSDISKKGIVYFVIYVLGLIIYGMGNYFLLKQVAISLVDIQIGTDIVSFLGIIFVFIGICLLGFVFYQFCKRVGDRKKILTLIVNYFLFILVSGVIFGLLGEFLYRNMNYEYEETKNIIWMLSTCVQETGRFIFLFYCIRLVQGQKFTWKDTEFQKLLLIVLLFLGVFIILSQTFSMLGTSVMFFADLVIAIGVVYKELLRSEKSIEGRG